MSAPAVYSVPEISCDHCVAAITGAVSPLNGVESVVIDVDAKTVAVTGGKHEAIVAAIDDAGYDIA